MLTGDEVLRLAHFQQLREAHQRLMACEVGAALDGFQSLIEDDPRALYYHPADGWLLAPDLDQPGLNNVCDYLGGYAVQRRKWELWQSLYAIVCAQPGWASLTTDQRLRLHALDGWGRQIYRRTAGRLDQALRAHGDALNTPGLSRLTTALHHMVSAQLHRQRRDLSNGLKHLDAADALLSWEDEPFYALFNLEHRGDLYYFLHLTHPGFADRAITLYREAEAKTRQYANGVDFTAHAYNLGWVYAETERFDKALVEFSRGADEARDAQDDHLLALYKYGLGYTHMKLERDSIALSYLEDALAYFCDESATYAAAVLNLIAFIYAKTAPDLAFEYIHHAYGHILKTDNPVQRHHIVRQLMQYHAKRRSPRAVYYLFDMMHIRLRYKMKLWPL